MARISPLSLRYCVVIFALGWTCQARGQPRLDAPSSTCAALQASLQRLGGALVSTGPFLYDFYFANESGCGIRRRPAPSYTGDKRQSAVLYRLSLRRIPARLTAFGPINFAFMIASADAFGLATR